MVKKYPPFFKHPPETEKKKTQPQTLSVLPEAFFAFCL